MRARAAAGAVAACALVLLVGVIGGFQPAAAMVFVAAMVVLTAFGYELHRRAIGIRPVSGRKRPRSD